MMPVRSNPTLNPTAIYITGIIPALKIVLGIPLGKKLLKKYPEKIRPRSPIPTKINPLKLSTTLDDFLFILCFGKAKYINKNPEAMSEEIKISLKRLQTDHVDLLLLHKTDDRKEIQSAL